MAAILKFKMATMTMSEKMEPSFFLFAIPEMTTKCNKINLGKPISQNPKMWTLDLRLWTIPCVCGNV